MNRSTGIPILILLIALVSGCSLVVQAPHVALKEAGVVGLDQSGIDVMLDLGITNPNAYDLSLLGCTFELQVLSRPLFSGGMQETILFPAGEETGMRLPVRLKFADLLEIINRAPDPDHIPYQLNSTLHLKTPLGRMDLPVEKRASLSIPEQYRPAALINRLRDALRTIR